MGPNKLRFMSLWTFLAPYSTCNSDCLSFRGSLLWWLIYRVFIKYCVFSQELSKVYHLSVASTRLLLVVQKITSQYEWLYSRIASFEGLSSHVCEGGFVVNCGITQFFSGHFVSSGLCFLTVSVCVYTHQTGRTGRKFKKI